MISSTVDDKIFSTKITSKYAYFTSIVYPPSTKKYRLLFGDDPSKIRRVGECIKNYINVPESVEMTVIL